MRIPALIISALLAVTTLASAQADQRADHECFSNDSMRRIEGCTALLQQPGLDSVTKSTALATRALALSIIGRYDEAIRDYDAALAIIPNYPVALNNRAWAKFKTGQVNEAEPDVEKSLQLDPSSPHAYDTRAHVRQWQGQRKAALRDYRTAMNLGGPKMVKLYQCGLQSHGLYNGPLTGIITEQLKAALASCVKSKSCDPLPPDEECKAALS